MSRQEHNAALGVWGGEHTHHLDVVDRLLLELLKCPLGLGLQGEGEALQRLVLALHTDLCLHLGQMDSERGPHLVHPPPGEHRLSPLGLPCR